MSKPWNVKHLKIDKLLFQVESPYDKIDIGQTMITSFVYDEALLYNTSFFAEIRESAKVMKINCSWKFTGGPFSDMLWENEHNFLSNGRATIKEIKNALPIACQKEDLW